MIDALDIWVKGVVQGVGFRPFVYRLAKRYLINGWVMNGVDGVHIHAEGESKLLDEFVMEISENAPAAAQITEIEMHEVPLEPYDSFEIRTSDESDAAQPTLVSPDLATCADCERELFDPSDRRFRYPFINCTNCGPRFTIIDELPYDRANTSMREFPMCDECAAEYADPENRRFHAQPDACFACGPALTWKLSGSDDVVIARGREETDAVFAEAVRMLLDGKILAVKGLGGYHLVCNANDPDAIARLRLRKHRDGKPLAVMMPSLVDAHRVCHVSNEEAALIQGSVRPIVLLRKRCGADLAKGLADRLPELGVMLPYTPVQHILLHDFAEKWNGDEGGLSPSVPAMLVMTSGNLHDEPIVISDEEAYRELAGVADAFLGNNREIVSRFDDSVVRVIRAGETEFAIQFIRRSRGYAPAPIALKMQVEGKIPTVFATGAEQKNTFTFLRALADGDEKATGDTKQVEYEQARTHEGDQQHACTHEDDASGSEGYVGADLSALNLICDSESEDRQPRDTKQEESAETRITVPLEAFVSQHIGDMENAETFDAWLEAKARYETLFHLRAELVACDLHPEYLTTKWAEEQCALARPPLPLVKVQHHFAHVVAAMAECGIEEACLGVAFDGTGFGVDGNIWGGEVMLANRSDFERFANFAYVPMPGGAAAIKNPLRMAYGVLWEFDLLDESGAASVLAALGSEQAELCEKMIEQGINTPVTSSVGRLFDAASAMLGVCTEPAYEGEAAILLEAALWEWLDGAAAGEGEPAAGSDRRRCEPARTQLDLSCSPEGVPYPITVTKNTATAESTAQDTSVLLLDAEGTFRQLLQDKEAGVPVGLIAKRFHDAFVDAILQVAQLAEALYGMRTVVLTGGVFMNRYLIERSIAALSNAGFTVALNRELPPNDGCISLGQAVVAVARHSAK